MLKSALWSTWQPHVLAQRVGVLGFLRSCRVKVALHRSDKSVKRVCEPLRRCPRLSRNLHAAPAT